MAITRVSSNIVEAASMTLPSHASLDYIVACAWREGSVVAPSLPAGWTNIGTEEDGPNNASRLAYKVAASGSETSGTWTNANGLIVVVYRGVASIGNAASVSGASVTLVNFPALTVTSGSWVAGFLGHRADNGAPGTAPSGMTNIASLNGAAAQFGLHDTNTGVSSWASTNAEIGGSNGNYNTWVLEIQPAAAAAGNPLTLLGVGG